MNGYTRRHETARRINYVIRLTSSTLNTETSNVILGDSKLKPIDNDTLLKRKYNSAALTTSMGSSNAAKTNNKASTISSTSAKNKFDKVSGQVSAVSEPQENESNSYAMSLDQICLSLKKYIKLI